MKPLILILLLSGAIQAQSQAQNLDPVQGLAAAARQERDRQAAFKNVQIFTTENLRQSIPAEKSETTAAPAESAKPAAKPAATTPAGTAERPVDPVAKWNEDVAKLRAIIVELQDRETADVLKLNQWLNQFYAPVTDPQTRSDAQAHIVEAQGELAETKKALQTARETLKAMEAQGPPKKP